MNKKIKIAVLTIAAAVLLAACACNTADTPSPTGSAAATPLASIVPSLLPDMSPEASPEASADAPTSPGSEQSGQSASQGMDTDSIRTEVEKLSEVKSAAVAAMGDTALVGLTFDDAYRGTLTARITEMVTEKVQSAETGITNVRVTADETLTKEIEEFASKQENQDGDSSQAREEFDALMAKLEPAS